MDPKNLLARIEQRARLHGPNETRRALCATLETLGGVLPPTALHPLLMRMPPEIRRHLSGAQPAAIASGREFITALAGKLHIETPDAAFLARVVFEQFNASGAATTPADVAHLAPADLRPLLSAQLTPAPARRPARVPELTTVLEFPRPVRQLHHA